MRRTPILVKRSATRPKHLWKSHSAIRQKEVGHLMMLTQRSILNRDSADVYKNKAEN